jgi:hypothetical protein
MSIYQQFMNAIGNEPNDAWDYNWDDFPNATVVGLHTEFGGLDMVYNRDTREVYEITVSPNYDASGAHFYRWVNPVWIEASKAEYEVNGLEWNDSGLGEKYIQLETVEDMLDKGVAIVSDKPYDARIEVPLDLPEQDLLVLFKRAHELDITFNELMKRALLDVIAERV